MLVINPTQSADTKHEDLWLDVFKVEIYELVLNGTALNLSALTSKRKNHQTNHFCFLLLKPEYNILNQLLPCLFVLTLFINICHSFTEKRVVHGLHVASCLLEK